MCEYSERLGQFLLRKIFRRPTYFDGLRHSDTKIFRLFNEPSRRHFVSFRRINEVKSKQVFLVTRTHMKTVAVVRWVRDESAIFQALSNLLIDLVREDRQPRSQRTTTAMSALTPTREKIEKRRDQTATSNWLIL